MILSDEYTTPCSETDVLTVGVDNIVGYYILITGNGNGAGYGASWGDECSAGSMYGAAYYSDSGNGHIEVDK